MTARKPFGVAGSGALRISARMLAGFLRRGGLVLVAGAVLGIASAARLGRPVRRVSIILASAASLLAAAAAWGAAGDLLWADRVDRSGGAFLDAGHAAASEAGLFFASGNSAGPDGDQDVIVRAYDPRTGALRWQDVYDPVNGRETSLDLAAANGRLFVGGRSETATGPNFLVRAHDARTGTLLWQNETPGPGGGSRALALAAGGGNVYAAGQRFRAPGDSDFFVSAYDARTGALLWQDQVDGGPGASARHVAVDAGRAYAVGWVGDCSDFFDNGGDCDFLVRAYDARSGTLLWQEQLDLGSRDIARAVSASADRVVVVGYGGDFANSDFLVRAYDARTGALAWHDRVDTAGKIDQAYSVAMHAGRVFAAGGGGDCQLLVEPGGDCDGLVRAYDARSGQLVWYDRVDKGNDDVLGSLAATGAIEVHGGRLFLSGWGGNCLWFDFSDCDVLVRVYRVQDGSLAWEAQFDNAGGDDEAQDLALLGGTLSVVGIAERAAGPPFPPGDWDLLVLAYDAAGA